VILAIANLKGGAAKTTTAVYLAHALGATLVDADPQASALGWSEAAAADRKPLDLEVVHLPTPQLAARLPHRERIVIDCSPRDHAITDAAMAAADLVLVPTATTTADMDRTWATLDLAHKLGRTTAVLLVRVRLGTRSLAYALDALVAEEVLVLRTRIPQREVLAAAWGRPIDRYYGYELVAAEVKEILNGRR